MKKLVAILLFFVILIAGTVGYIWYEKSQLDNKPVPVSTVKIDNMEMFKTSYDWNFKYFLGLLDKNIKAEINVDFFSLQTQNETPKISVLPDAAMANITVLYNGEQFFKGDADEFNQAFKIADDGDYYINAVVTHSDENGNGTVEFECILNAKITRPLEISISQETVLQGEIAVITAKNVPENTDITADSELGYIRFAKTDKNGEYKALVPIGYLKKAGEYPIAVTAGEEKKQFSLNVQKQDFEVQQMYISEEISDETVNSAAANAEFRKYVVPLYDTFDDNIYWQGAFTQPVIARISTPFGVIRYVNDDPTPTRHGGIDIAADLGEKIIAPNNGKVEYAGFLQLSGNTIALDHGGGLKSYFYHMDSLSAQTGQMVQTGDKLGTVGTTGYSTGAHLHYEVKIGRESLNPWVLFDGTSSAITK